MSVAIIGVAGTVIGAGATIYSTQAANKRAKASSSASTAGLNFGKTPRAAEYRPVDFTEEQWNGINANLSNLGAAGDLMKYTNGKIDSDALRRASLVIPNYAENMRLQGQNSNDLLNGRLPYDDVLDIVAKRGEAGNALGVPGTSAPATLRDLGLSRLDAIKTGSGLMKNMVDIAEQIDPVNRRMRPQDSLVSPTDRIKMTMEQNQLIQQSDQNRYNLEAGVSPSDSAASQLALAQRLGALGGGGGGSDVSGYAQALQGLIGGLGAAYKQSGSSGGYSAAADPGLTATGSYMGGVPTFTNRTSVPAGSTYNLSYRPTGIAV